MEIQEELPTTPEELDALARIYERDTGVTPGVDELFRMRRALHAVAMEYVRELAGDEPVDHTVDAAGGVFVSHHPLGHE